MAKSKCSNRELQGHYRFRYRRRVKQSDTGASFGQNVRIHNPWKKVLQYNPLIVADHDAAGLIKSGFAG